MAREGSKKLKKRKRMTKKDISIYCKVEGYRKDPIGIVTVEKDKMRLLNAARMRVLLILPQ